MKSRFDLVVFDGDGALMTASAGVPAVAVLTGARVACALLEFGPLASIESVAHLPAWLAQEKAATP